MVSADKVFAIRAKAEALAGRSLGDHGTALTEMAASPSIQYMNCSRSPWL